MKNNRKLLFFTILSLTGCATKPTFTYTSDVGRQCFYKCKAINAGCSYKCDDIYCFQDCSIMEANCMQTCPDVVEVAGK